MPPRRRRGRPALFPPYRSLSRRVRDLRPVNDTSTVNIDSHRRGGNVVSTKGGELEERGTILRAINGLLSVGSIRVASARVRLCSVIVKPHPQLGFA